MSASSENQKLAILVGGGPAPGINSVIASATIEAVNCGLQVIGLSDGFRWLVRGRHLSHDRTGNPRCEPNPFHRRLDSAHLAHQSRARRSRARARGPRIDQTRRPLPALYRRRRHHLRRGQDRRGQPRTDRRGDRTQDYRQRPAAARQRAHLRLRDRPRRGHRDHRVADGRRAHHRPLVPGDLDGP